MRSVGRIEVVVANVHPPRERPLDEHLLLVRRRIEHCVHDELIHPLRHRGLIELAAREREKRDGNGGGYPQMKSMK